MLSSRIHIGRLTWANILFRRCCLKPRSLWLFTGLHGSQCNPAVSRALKHFGDLSCSSSPALPLLPLSLSPPLPTLWLLLVSLCSLIHLLSGFYDWGLETASYLGSPQENTSLRPDNSAPLGSSPSTPCCLIHRSVYLCPHSSIVHFF